MTNVLTQGQGYYVKFASAFNQPLSFDTSSVTDMGFMFQVRSARAPLASDTPQL